MKIPRGIPKLCLTTKISICKCMYIYNLIIISPRNLRKTEWSEEFSLIDGWENIRKILEKCTHTKNMIDTFSSLNIFADYIIVLVN